MNAWEPKGLLRLALGLERESTPFPWQERLLERMLSGSVPEAIDIPTGLGKTSVMAIWLVARACGANLPRRLVYVVDRRAVVDQATEEALKLRTLVDSDGDLKARLGLRGDQSLPISTLRGQYVDNREWLDDPAAAAIIVGTVDMIGSRLLFEGYGVSRKMRPYHAGLLGADTLVVLDEAHLVPPFEHLLRAVATAPGLHARDELRRKVVPPFRLLALSATGRTRDGDVFRLTDKDPQHAGVRKRLDATKRLRLIALDTDTRLEDALAKHAWMLAGEGEKAVRVLVYADSREVARKAKQAVEKLAKGKRKPGKPEVKIETELLVGGRRVFEREEAKKRLASLGFIAGSSVAHSDPVFLFATSAGEVGVDLDADHMVCDLVAWERMIQRLGRVNRRGDGEANVVVIVEPTADQKTQVALDKRYRADTLSTKEQRLVRKFDREEAVRKLIERLPPNEDGTYNASPAALHTLKAQAASDAVLQEIIREATTPEPLRPALTRPLVEAWAMTSLEKHTGRPEIQPWLRGWIDDPPQTAVLWRTHLPVRLGGPAASNKEIEAFFEAAPPHMSEILETETYQAAEWLATRTKNVLRQRSAQDNGTEEPGLREEDVVAFALEPDGRLRERFTVAELVSSEAKEKNSEKKDLKSLLAGAILVLDARLAGLKDGLLDPETDDPPRTADDGQEWLGEGFAGFRVRTVEASGVLKREMNWHERLRFATSVTEDGEPTRWTIVEKWRHDAATEEDRSAAKPQLLDEHECWTMKRALRLGRAVGLDRTHRRLLALAARLHDEGKRAARWQRAFNAPNDGIYAKTEGPIDYRLLDGYRHELGSLLRVEDDERLQMLSEDQRDLVLHLIAAHHGFARPVIATSACEAVPPSALEEKAAVIALRFARLLDRWGPWGLAWWEALLRAADQQASRDNEARVKTGGGG